ncbi:MAG: hypothetical protein LBG77_07070 [Dysgonamonadaceae bacterium]|jgi:uncharacterized protein YxjI|nr:hypothetical protein [Dysgonamonadaceae bacterium]
MNQFPYFFSHNNYFIEEKVGLFKFNNAYKVFDTDGRQIGLIQQKMPWYLKILSLVLNKAMFPFTLFVMDNDNNVLTTIKRGWTFWTSKITVLDKNETPIAFINQKFKLLKPEFRILDTANQQIAVIMGDWKAWNFNITGNDNQQIGTISKKWNGILKEAFTTADKYIVSVAPEIAEDVKKMAIVSTAITIDMVLKESK